MAKVMTAYPQEAPRYEDVTKQRMSFIEQLPAQKLIGFCLDILLNPS
jgi:hypothetical protein